MKRSSNFLIAAGAAALTFGILTLAIGPKHMERWSGYNHRYSAHFNGAGHSCYSEHDKKTEENKPATEESQQ
jgi:hypothetical protein